MRDEKQSKLHCHDKWAKIMLFFLDREKRGKDNSVSKNEFVVMSSEVARLSYFSLQYDLADP